MRHAVTKTLLLLAVALFFTPAAYSQTEMLCKFGTGEIYNWDEAVKYRGDIIAFMHFCCKETRLAGDKTCQYAQIRNPGGRNIIHSAAKYRQEKALIYFMVRDRYLIGVENMSGEKENTKEENAILAKISKLTLDDITGDDLANQYTKTALTALRRLDDNGATPGMLAAQAGSLPITKFMVKWGPSPKQKDRSNRDMLWYAQQASNPDPGFMTWFKKMYETARTPGYSSNIEMQMKVMDIKDGLLNFNMQEQRAKLDKYAVQVNERVRS